MRVIDISNVENSSILSAKDYIPPKVSVIIAVYNAEPYIKQCLESLINQTLKEIEIICVDDFSTDLSFQILKEFEEKDSRISVIQQKHSGAGAARNKGIAAAKGKYLSILDADDFFEHDMLESAYNAAEKNNAEITVFQADFFNHREKRFEPCNYSIRLDMLPEKNPFGAKDIPEKIFNIGCGWAWDKLFNRDFVTRCDIEFQNTRTSNDMLFVFYLYSRAERIYVLRKCLVHQRINAAKTLSVTREQSWDNFYLALMVLKQRLIDDKTYEIFRHSFVNWAINFTLWNIDTLKSNIRKQLEIKCRKEYFKNLDILDNEKEYFIYDFEYERLKNMMSKDETTKVSVIIPVYNDEKYIRECLDSVCTQTLKDIQIICVNDGSTDTTAEILNEYEQKDERIVVINKDHTNAGDSRNIGLAIAEGEYLSFLDADDFFEKTMLEDAYNAAKKDDAEICAFRCNHYDDAAKNFSNCPWTLKLEEMPKNRPFSNHECADKIFTMTSCTAWDKIFKRSFINEKEIKFQDVPSCNDMLFTFSAYSVAEKITTLDKILAHQRINHVRTMSQDIEYMWHNFYDALMALKNFLIEREIYPEYKKSFVNWAIDFSIWNIHNYKEVFRDLIHQALKRSFFDDLDITSTPREDFYNQGLYDEMRRIIAERVIVPENEQPKVSVIIPTYNVEKYLRTCLDSAIYQTLENIEIIVVNDGSPDNCIDIINEYATKDRRIKVIDKENGGYGKAMNCGLDIATGEYIGIIEPDDFVELHMFEDLYNIAKKNNLDFVKADFNRFMHDEYGNIVLLFNSVAKKPENYNVVIKPSEETKSFSYIMNTWSGIYNREFLEKNGIRHNETPGASFQDNGFWFQTMMYAERAMFCNKPYYINRRDNPNSSVASKEKVYCMNEEYVYIHDILAKNPEKAKQLMGQFHWKKYHNYLFRYDVIALEYQEEYIKRMSDELKEAYSSGEIDETLFEPHEIETMKWIMEDPHDYYEQNNASTPLVSVIIPVYNAADHLRECLDSVLSQSLKKIEVICVDDGSEDESLEILNEYAQKDERVTVLKQENAGGGAARNKGIDIARGKYLSFLDSDDFFEKKMLEEAYKKSERTGAEICVYRVRRYNNETGEYTSDKGSFVEENFPSKKTGIEVFSSKVLGSRVFNTFQTWPWNKMFRRRFIMQKGLRFQEIQRTNDMYFVNSALMYADKITVVRIELVNYRIGTTKNCQATNHKAPTDFHKALIALYNEMQNVVTDDLLVSFSNLYVRSCNYNLNSLLEKDAEAFAFLYRYLHTDGFDIFDPTTIPEEIITADNRAAYKNCIQIRNRTFEDYMVDKLMYNRGLVKNLQQNEKKAKAAQDDLKNKNNKLTKERNDLKKKVDDLKNRKIKVSEKESLTEQEMVSKLKWYRKQHDEFEKSKNAVRKIKVSEKEILTEQEIISKLKWNRKQREELEAKVKKLEKKK